MFHSLPFSSLFYCLLQINLNGFKVNGKVSLAQSPGLNGACLVKDVFFIDTDDLQNDKFYAGEATGELEWKERNNFFYSDLLKYFYDTMINGS